MVGIIAAGIGASVIGGIASGLGAGAARKAAQQGAHTSSIWQVQQQSSGDDRLKDYGTRGRNALLDYTDKSVNALDGIYDRNQPAARIGNNALMRMEDFTTGDYDLSADAGYRFRQEQGEDALTRALAGRGIRLSGAGLKQAMEFNSGLASQEAGNAFGRLNVLAGYGQNARTAMDRADLTKSGLYSSTGNTLARLLQGEGFALNQNATGTADAVTGALTGVGTQRASSYAQGGDTIGNVLDGAFSTWAAGKAGYFGENPGLGVKPIANPYARTVGRAA